MGSLLYMGQNIFIFEKCDKEILLEEAGIPGTGLNSTEIWLSKDLNFGGMGRWKKKLLSLTPSPAPFFSLPPSLLPIYAYQRHSWWQCLGNASSVQSN